MKKTIGLKGIASDISNKSLYHSLFLGNPLPMWIYDPFSLKILDVNKAFSSLFGHTKKQAIKLTIQTLIDQDDWLKLTKAFKKIRAQVKESFKSGPWKMNVKSLKKLSMQIQSNAIVWKNKPARFAVALDITRSLHTHKKQQLTSKRLVQKSKQIQSVLQSINDGILVVDHEWNFILVNERIARKASLRPGDLIGKNMWHVFPTLRGSEFYKKCIESVETNTPIRFQNPGTIFKNSYFDYNLYPFDGGLTVFFNDITEKKKAEELKKDAEEKFSHIVRSMAEGWILINPDGIMIESNAAAHQVTGLTADQMNGLSIVDPLWRTIKEDGSPFPQDEYPAFVALRTGEEQFNKVMGYINRMERFRGFQSMPYPFAWAMKRKSRGYSPPSQILQNGR